MRTFAIVAAAALIVSTSSADAVEINAMITTAMNAAMEELAPPFERASGHVLRHLWTLRRARPPSQWRRAG
jgi:ABC-type tungstate transport system permease subunit